MAVARTIEVRQAVDWTMGTPQDPAPLIKDQNGHVVDITGWTFTMKVRAGATLASTVLLSLTSASGITNGGATGIATPFATGAQLAAMPSGTYPMDMVGVDLTGREYCIFYGNFVVDFTVSQ